MTCLEKCLANSKQLMDVRYSYDFYSPNVTLRGHISLAGDSVSIVSGLLKNQGSVCVVKVTWAAGPCPSGSLLRPPFPGCVVGKVC